ncbi:hypothetical protein [Embleya sp. MST-111070]|uniref:hypothetical protein n=1 Tax=Embleya sp. MST-111070 TaxID=3398231 RepID=UPI003F740523
MSDVTWDALAATPLPEVRRRAAVMDDLAGVAPVAVTGARRLAWNDGGGQSAVWYFAEDGRVLLLTFDHESALNLYAEEDFALQESFYRGVPESLVALVRDRPENYESLNLTESATGRTIHYAGGVFWYDGTRRHDRLLRRDLTLRRRNQARRRREGDRRRIDDRALAGQEDLRPPTAKTATPCTPTRR